jgi:hypothetical protein
MFGSGDGALVSCSVMVNARCSHLGIEGAEAEAGAGAMLLACQLAGLSVLETYYAGVRVGAQFATDPEGRRPRAACSKRSRSAGAVFHTPTRKPDAALAASSPPPCAPAWRGSYQFRILRESSLLAGPFFPANNPPAISCPLVPLASLSSFRISSISSPNLRADWLKTFTVRPDRRRRRSAVRESCAAREPSRAARRRSPPDPPWLDAATPLRCGPWPPTRRRA